jgi:hypothetical protein
MIKQRKCNNVSKV